MSFLKKILKGGTTANSHAEHEKADKAAKEKMPKETHEKEHQGEHKKPKNICEFC